MSKRFTKMGHHHSTHASSNNLIHCNNKNTANSLLNIQMLSNNNNNNNRVMDLKMKSNSIKDDYYITKTKLGYGLNGSVVTCIDKKTNKEYALKTLIDSTKARREVTLHYKSCQNTPYIVKIVDVYENICGRHRVLFVVMERMKGGELFDQIMKRADQHRPFTEQEVAKMMFQISSAVKHLHDMNIAHRDLKPENLLLTENGESIIKLTDFGFAKESSLGLKTPCYTPYYVAPEVFGPAQYDKSCDIWSLGVIMYILCCGYPPFYSEHGENISPGMKRRIRAGAYTFPEKEWSRVSIEAKDLIHDMLETSTEKRITIKDVMSTKWISQYSDVPDVELDACTILKQDQSRISAMEDAMDKALTEMRVDQKLKLKPLQESDNPLLKKRMDKTSNNKKSSEQQQAQVLTNNNSRLNSNGQTDEESTML